MAVQPVPDGFHTITPYLSIHGATALLEFVKKAFDAVETECLRSPDGEVRHAQARVGTSMLMMGECPPDKKTMPAMLYLYVDDVDALFHKAVAAGGTVVTELTDQFYGDRVGAVVDASGTVWYLASHKEDVPEEEIERRMADRDTAGS